MKLIITATIEVEAEGTPEEIATALVTEMTGWVASTSTPLAYTANSQEINVKAVYADIATEGHKHVAFMNVRS